MTKKRGQKGLLVQFNWENWARFELIYVDMQAMADFLKNLTSILHVSHTIDFNMVKTWDVFFALYGLLIVNLLLL